MRPPLVKAEILFSRLCPIRCAGCAMPWKRSKALEASAKMPMEKWDLGMKQLKSLGCGILPTYGAEPLEEFGRLIEYIDLSRRNDLEVTLITSCMGMTKERLRELYVSGLNSLTVSVDGEDASFVKNAHSLKKSQEGWKWIEIWKDQWPDLDAEVCMTATRDNYKLIPTLVEYFSNRGIWLHFDILHSNRGQPGSKVQESRKLDNLLLRDEDLPSFKKVCEDLLHMKDSGKLIHPSREALNLAASTKGVNFGWQCCNMEQGFIGMVTVNADGACQPCDDLNPPELDDDPIYVWELADRFEEYISRVPRYVKKYDCRCSWLTHLDAELIYNGLHSAEHYYHKNLDSGAD